MEASVAAAPDKALVLAVTKQMLYGEETPLVGVRLMYKPHYISTEPFSATYMHLHVWHAAGSSVESEDKLNSSRLIFVNVSEMSDVIPVGTQHPVLLDVATKETMMRTGEPMHPGLHLDYDLDFQTWRVDDIAPTLTSPLLSGLVSNIRLLGRPVIPNKPVSPKVEEGLWGRSGTPTRPDAPGPSRDGRLVPRVLASEVEAKENKPCEQGGIDLDQTLLGPDPEEVAAVVISDDDEADLPIDMPQAASMLKSEPVWSQK